MSFAGILWIFCLQAGTIVLGALDGNFRRDVFLADTAYREPWADEPLEGGRLQLIFDVATSMSYVSPYTMDFGGFNITLSPDSYPDNIPSNGLNWAHAEYNGVTGSLFTSLHFDNDALMDTMTAMTVVDAAGAVIASAPLGRACIIDLLAPDVQVTYATSRAGFSEMIVHLHNFGQSACFVDSLELNHGEAVAVGAELQPGEHRAQVLGAAELQLGETAAWTVRVAYSCVGDGGSRSSSYGGRLLKELFPVEDWPKAEQCPFPVADASAENHAALVEDLAVNTHFLGGTCDADVEAVFADAARVDSGYFLLPSEGYWLNGPGRVPASALPGVAAAFLGDESDSSVEATWEVWARSLTAGRDYPAHATYDGGHSNRLNGRFAGLTDVQGMDFYVAGCAPHVTPWAASMPIQGSYDYLRTNRENHRPLPTWMYSQGWCADCWAVRDLEPGELVVQLASVVAAGAKGVMLFQSDLTLRGSDSWVAGSRFLHSVGLLSDFLRTADIDGALFTTSADRDTALVSVLGDVDSLLVVAISTKASGYNDKTCVVTSRHWAFEPHAVEQIAVQLPGPMVDSGTALELVEAVNGVFVPAPAGVDIAISGGSLTLSDVELGTVDTARMFYLRSKQ